VIFNHPACHRLPRLQPPHDREPPIHLIVKSAAEPGRSRIKARWGTQVWIELMYHAIISSGIHPVWLCLVCVHQRHVPEKKNTTFHSFECDPAKHLQCRFATPGNHKAHDLIHLNSATFRAGCSRLQTLWQVYPYSFSAPNSFGLKFGNPLQMDGFPYQQIYWHQHSGMVLISLNVPHVMDITSTSGFVKKNTYSE
jgi:hypothetical protein